MVARSRRAGVMEVAQGVHRLSGGVTNFYLIEEGGRFTLVDAGAPRDWALFARAMESRGRSIHDLEAVVLTHAHADHTGFAERARLEAKAQVRVHDLDAAVARGGKAGQNDGTMLRYLWRPEAYRTLVSLLRRGAVRVIPIAEVSTFRDGEALDVPGRPRVIHAPGHTPGNAALLIEDRETLLTGDSLVTRNPLTGRTGPQIMPTAFNHDTAAALRSLAALASARATTLLPGHGEPWSGGIAEAVQKAQGAGLS